MSRTAVLHHHILIRTVLLSLVLFTGCAESFVPTDPPVAAVDPVLVERLVVLADSSIEHQEVDFHEAVRMPGKLVIVDFWAHWCGPCRMLAPELEKVATKLRDDVVILKVNVDESPTLARHFGANAIPDVRFFRDGKSVGGVVGFQTAEQLLSKLPDIRPTP